MNLNEAARTILEIGDSIYPWKWTSWAPFKRMFDAKAKTTDLPRDSVEIVIDGDTELGEFAVTFSRGGSMGKTGQGDAFKIFSTVQDVIREFIKKYRSTEKNQIYSISFDAEKERDPDAIPSDPNAFHSGSRESLYKRWTQKFAKEIGATVKTDNTTSKYATGFTFVFPKEKRKLATEAREMLNEIGNTTLPYEWSVWKSSRQHFRATARTTTDDIQLLIAITLDLYSGMTDVVFSRNVDSGSFSGQSWSTKKTGEGEQFKIFSTVKNVIEDFVKKYESERGERDMPIGAIRFSADKDQGGGENSRTSLYRTWAKKYARQVGGKFEEKKDRRENSYTIYFSRKKRKLATEAREILDEEIIGKLRDLGIEEAKIVWTPDQIKSMQKASAAEKNDLKKKFSKGKITIKWSQSRAGHAIFVKGRMEGPLFDTEEDAKEYLRDLGIDK